MMCIDWLCFIAVEDIIKGKAKALSRRVRTQEAELASQGKHAGMANAMQKYDSNWSAEYVSERLWRDNKESVGAITNDKGRDDENNKWRD